MDIIGYIRLIQEFQQKSKEIGPVALDILEIFAHNESLTAYQIFSKLKSTPLKMAYKNVHKRVQRLHSLSLIEEKHIDRRAEHAAKYYRLTEYGIFQLFLKRVYGIFVDNLSIKKHDKPQLTTSKKIFEYYRDNTLFDSFLYPYFDKNEVVKFDEDLCADLFEYLHECCKEVDSILQSKLTDIPVHKMQFLWHRVPGSHNKLLLQSLKKVFDLDDIDNAIIEKFDDDNALRITNPQYRIVIELDQKRKIAVAMLDKTRRRYEYGIQKLGSFIQVDLHLSYVGYSGERFYPKRSFEKLIYELISGLGRSSTEEYSVKFKTLSEDNKFMNSVDDMFKSFEKGYKILLKLRSK